MVHGKWSIESLIFLVISVKAFNLITLTQGAPHYCPHHCYHYPHYWHYFPLSWPSSYSSSVMPCPCPRRWSEVMSVKAFGLIIFTQGAPWGGDSQVNGTEGRIWKVKKKNYDNPDDSSHDRDEDDSKGLWWSSSIRTDTWLTPEKMNIRAHLTGYTFRIHFIHFVSYRIVLHCIVTYRFIPYRIVYNIILYHLSGTASMWTILTRWPGAKNPFSLRWWLILIFCSHDDNKTSVLISMVVEVKVMNDSINDDDDKKD